MRLLFILLLVGSLVSSCFDRRGEVISEGEGTVINIANPPPADQDDDGITSHDDDDSASVLPPGDNTSNPDMTAWLVEANLPCSPNQIVKFDGTNWNCAADAVTTDASQLSAGTLAEERLPSGIAVNKLTATASDGQVLTANGSTTAWAELPLPEGYIRGLVPKYTSTTAILVKAGKARSDDDADNMVLASDTAVSIDSVGINGLDAGVKAISTWYSIWLLKGASGVGAVLSSEDTGLTMPAGYDQVKRRVGWIRVNSSSNIRAFAVNPISANGRYFSGWPENSITVSSTATSNYEDISTLVPPSIEWAKIGLWVSTGDVGSAASRRVLAGHADREGVEALEAYAYGGDWVVYNAWHTDTVNGPIQLKSDATTREVNCWYVGNPSSRLANVHGWYDPMD